MSDDSNAAPQGLEQGSAATSDNMECLFVLAAEWRLLLAEPLVIGVGTAGIKAIKAIKAIKQ